MALLKTFPLDPDAGYGFEWLRGLLEAHLQEGVLNAGDYKATPAAAGGNRVDVAAGIAFIKGDSGVPGLGLTQGLYMQVNDAAILNAVTFRAGDANPRLDQVVLSVNDTSDLGSASNTPTISIVEGAPTAGATLDNRAGAAALPANSIRIADRLIPAGSNTLVATDLRDRRPWARGGYFRLVRTAGNYTTTSTAAKAAIDATNLAPRLECSGVPLRITLNGLASTAAAGGVIRVGALLDGANIDGFDDLGGLTTGAAGVGQLLGYSYASVPAAGSHVLAPSWNLAVAGTGTLQANATQPLVLTVEELVRQNQPNT